MAVKIRLKRMGKKKQPTYRVVVADGRSPRDGRFIEVIGRYDPRQEPSVVEIDNEKALDWLHKGAQPTDPVRKLLEISGAWSRFKVAKGEIHTVASRPAPEEPKAEQPPTPEEPKTEPPPTPEEPKAEQPPTPEEPKAKQPPTLEEPKTEPQPASEAVDIAEDATAEPTEDVAPETEEPSA
jgi:small subunit ribosomal protein S16